MLSNCAIWARIEYARRKREWRRAGMPIDKEPCLSRRPSRSEPRSIDHRFVSWWNPFTQTNSDIRSFSPIKRVDLPIWLAWLRALFRGHVKAGDEPTQPPPV